MHMATKSLKQKKRNYCAMSDKFEFVHPQHCPLIHFHSLICSRTCIPDTHSEINCFLTVSEGPRNGKWTDECDRPRLRYYGVRSTLHTVVCNKQRLFIRSWFILPLLVGRMQTSSVEQWRRRWEIAFSCKSNGIFFKFWKRFCYKTNERFQ